MHHYTPQYFQDAVLVLMMIRTFELTCPLSTLPNEVMFIIFHMASHGFTQPKEPQIENLANSTKPKDRKKKRCSIA
jgi:hypothetical protein